MSTDYWPAPQDIIDLVRELIDLYHDDLQDARIGLLLRDKAPTDNGRVTLGAAKKLPPDMRVYLPFDFVIWVARDWWDNLAPMQQRALLDHELYHCRSVRGEWKLRGHDIEEFNAIIERYGFWRPFSEGTALALQRQFGFLQNMGSVTAADPRAMERDVLDQVEGLLDDDGATDGGQAA